MYSSWVVGQSFVIFVYQYVYFGFYFCLPVCVFWILFLCTSMCILDFIFVYQYVYFGCTDDTDGDDS